MAGIGDLSIGQNVLVAGQITALNPVGGSRYDTVKLALAKSVLKDEQKFIFADPNNIDLASQELLARYEAVIDEETLEALEDGSASIMNTAVTNISSAEILDLHDTPVELVPAPGAGKAVYPIAVFIDYKFVTTAYSRNGGGTSITYAGSNTAAFDLDLAINFIESTESFTQLAALQSGAAVLSLARTVVEDAALVIKHSTADPTLGDGTLRITTVYKIIDLS